MKIIYVTLEDVENFIKCDTKNYCLDVFAPDDYLIKVQDAQHTHIYVCSRECSVTPDSFIVKTDDFNKVYSDQMVQFTSEHVIERIKTLVTVAAFKEFIMTPDYMFEEAVRRAMYKTMTHDVRI